MFDIETGLTCVKLLNLELYNTLLLYEFIRIYAKIKKCLNFRICLSVFSWPHITRFLSCDASHQIGCVMT